MKFMGSKSRIAKHILPIILKDRKEGQYFYDLFTGGCNIADKVSENVIACDNNKYLIEVLKMASKNIYGCETIDKPLYDNVRNSYNNNDNLYTDFEIGWIGFMASANGRFFDGGYGGQSKTKLGTIRDYTEESIKNIKKQNISHVEFIHASYDEIDIKPNSIIYCDIPYKNTKQYNTSKDFDYYEFYDWCVDKHNQGHKVFISEYEMPSDIFKCVWQQEVKSSLSANGVSGGSKKSIEKLFIVR